jgi:hypothetical protein
MLPSDRILQHQYRAKNYQNYSDLIHDFLQAEKHDELTLRNHHQCSVGSAPLPEVHHNVKGNERGDGSNNHQTQWQKHEEQSQRTRERQSFYIPLMWWSKPLC